MDTSDLLFKKGQYPYEYMDSLERFKETSLPPREAFYDRLRNKPLSEKNYQHALDTWQQFGICNMHEYHDHYLKLDVLLLADVFNNFRESILRKHNLDVLFYVTLPSLAWSMALRHTKIELELICSEDQYLMVENSIRGGIATIATRFAEANNPYLGDDYDPSKPTTYIYYLDANSLYATAQSQPLPVGNYHFLSDTEIHQFDLDSIADDSPIGYLLDVDLTYPPELHYSHSDYPMAPDHFTPTYNMLSSYTRRLIEDGVPWNPSRKLIPNLHNKSNYVCYYRNLQLYKKHGLIVTKIHRILAFSQRPWMRPWIELCNRERREAKSEFESDLSKLVGNSTFGKTLENVRYRKNIRLIADPVKLQRAVSKPTFRESMVVNGDLAIVKMQKQTVKLNKPIGVGMVILERSKLLMYSFYYDYLKAKYQEGCSLLFTDTDSLCCYIKTQDIYKDMEEDKHMYDTSNFAKDHPAYSSDNHRAMGKFKSETGSQPPKQFVGLRAKMYSLLVPSKDPKKSKSVKKVKGILKHFVKDQIRHENFLDVLRQSTRATTATLRMFRSRYHRISTVEITKRCLTSLDDKRVVQDDGIHTLAYGHHALTDHLVDDAATFPKTNNHRSAALH